MVDNFGVSYVNRADREHLEAALKKNYSMTVDWTDNTYIGITLDWNYSKREMRSSMPGYVKKTLKQLTIYSHPKNVLTHQPLLFHQNTALGNHK